MEKADLIKSKEILMGQFIIGVISGLLFFFTVKHISENKLAVKLWQWIVLFGGLVYLVFTIEVIAAFIQERAWRGALVMGVLLGVVAAIWAVLLLRFVLLPKQE